MQDAGATGAKSTRGSGRVWVHIFGLLLCCLLSSRYPAQLLISPGSVSPVATFHPPRVKWPRSVDLLSLGRGENSLQCQAKTGDPAGQSPGPATTQRKEENVTRQHSGSRGLLCCPSRHPLLPAAQLPQPRFSGFLLFLSHRFSVACSPLLSPLGSGRQHWCLEQMESGDQVLLGPLVTFHRSIPGRDYPGATRGWAILPDSRCLQSLWLSLGPVSWLLVRGEGRAYDNSVHMFPLSPQFEG